MRSLNFAESIPSCRGISIILLMKTPPTAPTAAPDTPRSGRNQPREERRRAHVWSGPLHALARFAKGYALKGGFLDGAIGWDIAAGNAREVWLKYHLLWKLNREQ